MFCSTSSGIVPNYWVLSMGALDTFCILNSMVLVWIFLPCPKYLAVGGRRTLNCRMKDCFILNWQLLQRERPYQHDSTTSRPLCEVKHARARLVLRWGTTLESRVLFSFESWPYFFVFATFTTPTFLVPLGVSFRCMQMLVLACLTRGNSTIEKPLASSRFASLHKV